jgi:hypothetical protein
MKWPVRNDDGWRRRFAILPHKIGDTWVWLEWFERRFAGDYSEVREIEHGD